MNQQSRNIPSRKIIELHIYMNVYASFHFGSHMQVNRIVTNERIPVADKIMVQGLLGKIRNLQKIVIFGK